MPGPSRPAAAAAGVLLVLLLSPARPDRSPLTFPMTVYEYAYTPSTANFVPSVLHRSCMLPPAKGPCRAKVPMYRFNYQTRACEQFNWGGCQGNGNRFDTERQCTDYCLSKNTTKPSQPSHCQLSFDYGFCFGDMKRWHYDRVQQVCKQRVFSGCGGNQNNFLTKQMCEASCMYMRTYPTRWPTTPPSLPLNSDEK